MSNTILKRILFSPPQKKNYFRRTCFRFLVFHCKMCAFSCFSSRKTHFSIVFFFVCSSQVDDRGLFGKSIFGMKFVAGLSMFLTVGIAFVWLFGCRATALLPTRDRPMEMRSIRRSEAAPAAPDSPATTRGSDEDLAEELPPMYDSLFPS